MSRITKRKYVVQEVLDYVVPTGNQQIVQITGGRGNNLHAVVDAKGENFLVSMPTKFRKNIYIKRGDFVIIDPIEEGDKVRGEITNVLIKDCIEHIQEEGLWPEAFVFETEKEKTESYIEDDLLPPSDSEDDDDDLGFKVVNANKANQLYEDDDEEEDEDDEEEEEDEERGKEEEEEQGEEESGADENTVQRDTNRCDSEKHERLDDKSARSSKDSEVDSLAKGIEQLTAT